MQNKHKQEGLPAGKWEPLFKKAGVEKERLEAAKSEKARTTILGNFLAQNVGREVPVEVNGQTGKATLHMIIGRAKQKQYLFEVVWDKPEDKRPDKPKGKSLSKPSGPQPVKTKSQKCSRSDVKMISAPKEQKRLIAIQGNNESWN